MPTLRTYSDRLEDITQAYSEDAEFHAAAESVRRSLERSPVPVEEPGDRPAGGDPIEPVAQAPEPAPLVRTLPVWQRALPAWQRALSLVKARPKLWGAGALAGLSVLLLIGAVSLILRPKPSKVAPKEGTLEITTSPAGAAVLVNGKPAGTAMPALLLSMAAGSVEIEARLPGYQTTKTEVKLAGGARLAVPLTLPPVLALKLSFPSEGRVAINNEEPVTVTDGQFFRELPVGTYSVKLSTGRSGTIAFAFEVRPDGPAVITGPPRAQEVSALLISNFGDQTRIYTGASSADVKLTVRRSVNSTRTVSTCPSLRPRIMSWSLAQAKIRGNTRSKSARSEP